MISIILYVMRFYILPRKIYTGLYCLEEWATDVAAWNAAFRMAAILDIVFCLIGIAMALQVIIIDAKKSSSKEKA